MFHTVTAWSLTPITEPIDDARGPETTSMTSTTATRRMATRVTSRVTGRSFQNGRPSSIS